MSSDQDSSRDKELDKRLERKSSNIEALAKLLTDDIVRLIKSSSQTELAGGALGLTPDESFQCSGTFICGGHTCSSFKQK